MKNSCCFFGHRKISASEIQTVVANLDREIDTLIQKGVADFISGGALGFDQIAASLIVIKKEMGLNIRLKLALPCRGQDALWNHEQKRFFQTLLGQADEIIYVSQQYDVFCMKRRNHYMVEHSAYCICALLDAKSETAQTVRYACEKGLEIINVGR